MVVGRQSPGLELFIQISFFSVLQLQTTDSSIARQLSVPFQHATLRVRGGCGALTDSIFVASDGQFFRRLNTTAAGSEQMEDDSLPAVKIMGRTAKPSNVSRLMREIAFHQGYHFDCPESKGYKFEGWIDLMTAYQHLNGTDEWEEMKKLADPSEVAALDRRLQRRKLQSALKSEGDFSHELAKRSFLETEVPQLKNALTSRLLRRNQSYFSIHSNPNNLRGGSDLDDILMDDAKWLEDMKSTRPDLFSAPAAAPAQAPSAQSGQAGEEEVENPEKKRKLSEVRQSKSEKARALKQEAKMRQKLQQEAEQQRLLELQSKVQPPTIVIASENAKAGEERESEQEQVPKSLADGFNLDLGNEDENFENLARQWGTQSDVKEPEGAGELKGDQQSEELSEWSEEEGEGPDGTRMADGKKEAKKMVAKDKGKTTADKSGGDSDTSRDHLWIEDLNASARAANLTLFDYCKFVKSKPNDHSLELWSLARRYINRELKQFKRFHVMAFDDMMMESIELARNNSYHNAYQLQFMRMFERRKILREEGLLLNEDAADNSSREVLRAGWEARDKALLQLQKQSPSGFIREEVSARFNQTVLIENGVVDESLLLSHSDDFSSFDNLPDDDDDESVDERTQKRDKEWEARYLELQAFHRQHGHSNVPKRHVENPPLGTWVMTQRSKIRKGLLAAEKKLLLEELNFEWELKKNKNTKVGKAKTTRVSAAPGAAARRSAKKSAAVKQVEMDLSAFLVKHKLLDDVGQRVLEANVSLAQLAAMEKEELVEKFSLNMGQRKDLEQALEDEGRLRVRGGAEENGNEDEEMKELIVAEEKRSGPELQSRAEDRKEEGMEDEEEENLWKGQEWREKIGEDEEENEQWRGGEEEVQGSNLHARETPVGIDLNIPVIHEDGTALSVIEILQAMGKLRNNETEHYKALEIQEGIQSHRLALQDSLVRSADIMKAQQLREATKMFYVKKYFSENAIGSEEVERDVNNMVECPGIIGEREEWKQHRGNETFTPGQISMHQWYKWFKENKNLSLAGVDYENLVVDQLPQVPKKIYAESVIGRLEEKKHVEDRFMVRHMQRWRGRAVKFVSDLPSVEGLIESMWKEGWDVEKLFGEQANVILRSKYPYYPLRGTGIGIEWMRQGAELIVTRVAGDSPCRGKVETGDTICFVDGELVTTERMCEKLIRGEPGSEISLVVLPKATKRRLEYSDIELTDLVEVKVPRMEFHPDMLREHKTVTPDYIF
ncbi:hypothetical protein GUITHDRAFT_118481 [Guillardia theta CCMP2712]|uniref:Helicase-associated domain-containing protein n=1 Tax=Guillardia theta (strain CCMP2712) TaxID=905079 RepID=L1IH13_GUITC|nr:hypothetical protein GUITHDRAFT_118481 [Guillardia theta CCMP2712]EKX35357.1 hypothetical protein GUITHDRAFT_118481 [Guillardia theta CCMP2712]|eukprot:XP_005822337.1 hypothetical protein GUITHDRAFT_118481 [Guillardia theta CCMP2712]